MIENFVQVDGLKIRYLEEGKGPEVILLHGASLGSSADVWERNLERQSDAGGGRHESAVIDRTARST